MAQSSQLKRMTFKAVKGVNFRRKFLRSRKPFDGYKRQKQNRNTGEGCFAGITFAPYPAKNNRRKPKPNVLFGSAFPVARGDQFLVTGRKFGKKSRGICLAARPFF